MKPRPALLALALWTATATTAAADVTGRLVYVDREFTFDGGFTGQEPLVPSPRTAVRVLDAATEAVLGTAFTDADGRFAVAVAGSGPRDVIVRAFAVSEAFGTERVTVEDPSGLVHSTSTDSITIPDLALDVDVGTVVAPIVTGTGGIGGVTGLGGPFNLLHRGIQAVEYALDQGAAPLPESITLVWPVLAGSFATPGVANISLDDGFDDTVILHELGHVLQFMYSDTDNPGLGHAFGQSDQDPRLSLGEGWASFFAGAVRQWAGDPEPGIYMDLFGDGLTGEVGLQLRFRFEDGFPLASTTEGEADEGAVASALWDLVDRADTDDGLPGDDDLVDGSFELVPGESLDRTHWRVFEGPTVVNAPALHVVDVWDGYFVDAGATATVELADAFVGWSIHVFPDALEPDDGAADATPLTLSEAWGPMRTLYASGAPFGAPGTGDVDAYAIELAPGSPVEFETRYPDDNPDAGTYADPDLRLFDPSGALVASAALGGDGRNARIADFDPAVAGTYRLEVFSGDPARPTGSYDLRARPAAPPDPPVIASLQPESADSVTPGAGPFVTVLGDELQFVTSVTIGGQPVDFNVVDDSRIFVQVPLLPALGPLDLVISGSNGSASATYTLLEPVPPALNAADGIQVWFPGEIETIAIGAGAGDLAFLLASLASGPTALPGLAALDIGGGDPAGLFLLETFVLGSGGSVAFDVPVDPLPSGVDIFLQAAVLDGPSPAFPLGVSNWAQVRKL